MTTLNEMIETIKAENPTLRKGSEEEGYTDITGQEYDQIIAEWAENRLKKIKVLKEKEDKKSALLEKLGISEDEAKLLLL